MSPNVTSAGFDYETTPRIVIASPPFVPKPSVVATNQMQHGRDLTKAERVLEN